jgi:hypothetical protein
MTVVEQKVDELLNAFDAWFQSKGNAPLIKTERAILKTLAWWLINISDRPKLPTGLEDKAEDAQDRDRNVVLPVRPGGNIVAGPVIPSGPRYPGVPGFGDP